MWRAETPKRFAELSWVTRRFVTRGKQLRRRSQKRPLFGARQEPRKNRTRNNHIKNGLTHRLLSSAVLGDVRLHRKRWRTNVNEAELNTPRSRCTSEGMRSGRNPESIDSHPPKLATSRSRA